MFANAYIQGARAQGDARECTDTLSHLDVSVYVIGGRLFFQKLTGMNLFVFTSGFMYIIRFYVAFVLWHATSVLFSKLV